MQHINMPKVMRQTALGLILKGKSIGFVPTMGALHDGHLSLVKLARDENDVVVVSIFVNPLQFAQNEDFDKYPRTLMLDLQKLQDAEVDIVFCPESKAMYSEGFCTNVSVKGLSQRLCGAFRPGHFDGVATVVTKLFNIVMPARAYFGQKDYQQTLIIKRLVEDLDISTEVVVCPTVREPDGLAMSSRNSYLTALQRSQATVIYKTLKDTEELIRQKALPIESLALKMYETLKSSAGITEVQYAGIYDPETLLPSTEYSHMHLLAVAVIVGDTRLIDNILVKLN